MITSLESVDVAEHFIYLDYNATTPLAEEVITGISTSLVSDWGNPSSSNPYADCARNAIGKARGQIAKMLGCSPTEITFTSGGTESNNLIIYSAIQYFWDRFRCVKNVNQIPHIITTNVEHDSVLLPLRKLEMEEIIEFTIVEVNHRGQVEINKIISEIKPNTCLITVMYANNETGVIMPIPELGKCICEMNERRKKSNFPKILYHTDAAQMIGKEKVNFYASKVDFMTIVGHKFYGPRIGCICAKEKIYPLFFGGGHENGLRPGTENTPMIVGLGIAADLVYNNIEQYKNHMLTCRKALEKRLKELFGDKIVINCEDSERLPNTTNISFTENGAEGPKVLGLCKRVIASCGSACHGGACSQILINSGVPTSLAKNAIRLSVGRNTTLQDIEDAALDLASTSSKAKSGSKCQC